MIVLDVNKLNKHFGYGSLLEDVSFSIQEGEKVAIVGDNGCGKSTLLKIISNLESLDSGTISVKKNARIEYLEQGDVADTRTGKCKDILREVFVDLFAMQEKLHNMEEKMCELTGDELDKVIRIYSNTQEEFIARGGYDIDMNIKYVISGLGIENKLLEREFSTLSGGERTLVNLARILLMKPDILLLDEPTNHLDMDRIAWLEKFVKAYSGTIIIVSHDRYFLDKSVNRILEIHDKQLKSYIGNYSQYLQQKEDEETKQFAIFKVQQKKISEMEKAIKRLKEWGKQSDNPMFFRRAKAIQSCLDRLKSIAVEQPKERRALPINFVASSRGSQDVVIAKRLNLFAGQKQLLNFAQFGIYNGEKVAIIGKNGCGKSTLVKAILGEYKDFEGEIKLSSNQRVGYLAQIIEFDDKKQYLLDYFISETAMSEQEARSVLFKFQFFRQDISKRVGDLSGGEKLRLKLAVLLQSNINLLIFDEPTNHIDIFTREILEDTLKEFKGTILFVSHDRYFINKIANKILFFKDTKIGTVEGDYEEYLKAIE